MLVSVVALLASGQLAEHGDGDGVAADLHSFEHVDIALCLFGSGRPDVGEGRGVDDARAARQSNSFLTGVSLHARVYLGDMLI
jgi:hypothetical protein